MQHLPFRILGAFLGLLPAAAGSASGDEDYRVAIGEHDEVLACWRGDQLLLPPDCIGKDVIAYRRTLLDDEVGSIAGLAGRVGAETHEGYYQALPATSDNRFMLDTSAIYFPALELDEWLDRHRAGEVPLLPGHSADPAPRFVQAVSDGSRQKDIKLRTGRKPEESIARAELKTLIEEMYLDPLFIFFAEDSYFRAPLVWLDMNDDGRSEALTIVTTYDEATGTGCADLLIVNFDDDGRIKEREKLVAEKRANACTLRDLGYGGWWSIELMAWPGMKHGVALALESGMDSGDGYALFVLNGTEAGSAPRIVADFLYVWVHD